LKKEDFLTYYTQLSNVELLKIMEEKEKYQPEAITLVNEILAQRNFTDEDECQARSEINLLLNKKKEQQEKVDKRINRINGFIDEHFGLRQRSPEKTLNIFCVVIFFYSLIVGFFSIKDLAGYFNSKIEGYIVGSLIYILQLLIVFLLYKRSNWGWVCYIGLYVFFAVSGIVSFILFFYYKSEFPFIRGNPYPSLLSFVCSIGIILFLNNRKIIAQFSIQDRARIATIVVSLLLSVFLIFFLSLL
jgi:hypothetical protein